MEPEKPAAPTASLPLSIVRDIREAVKTGLIRSNEAVRAKLVEGEVTSEINKRHSAALKVFEKIEALEMEIRKIKPTFPGYTLSGEPIGEPFYTKEQADNTKKNSEQLARLNAALSKALTDNDFSKVLEMSK